MTKPIIPKKLNYGWENGYFKYFTINDGDVVLDLGATKGEFSAMCLEIPNTKCVAVEASNFNSVPMAAALEQWNSCLGEQRFFPVRRAITGNDSGNFLKIDTNILDGRRWASEDCIALDQTDIKSDSDLRGKDGYVETISFMDLIRQYDLNHINFLKMDVEGSEYSIFEDEESFNFILNNVDKMAIEFHVHYIREVMGLSRDEAAEYNNEIIERFVDAGHDIHVAPRTKYSSIDSDRATLYTDCMDFWAVRK